MRDRSHQVRAASGLIKRSEIEALALLIHRKFKPLKIVLFGSYAWGRPNRDSDVDLFLELRTRRDPAGLATEIACAVNAAFPLDLVIRTPEDIRWRLAEGDSFICDILQRGRVLHEARHARVG